MNFKLVFLGQHRQNETFGMNFKNSWWWWHDDGVVYFCLSTSNDLWKALKAFSSLYLIETLKLVDLKGTSNKSTTPYKSPSSFAIRSYAPSALYPALATASYFPLPIQNHTRELQSITIKASGACVPHKTNCRNTIIFKASSTKACGSRHDYAEVCSMMLK